MFPKLVVLLLAVTYASAHHISTDPCVNITSHCKDLTMKVSECNADHERCPLYQGKNHTVVFECTPTKSFNGKTDFRVHGVFEKFSVPYKGKADACQAAVAVEGNVKCSDDGGFKKDKRFRHTSIFSVSKNYPKISLRVRFSMNDRRSKEFLMCSEIPVEIKSSPTAG